VFDPPYYNGPKKLEGVRQFTLLNTFRPWWATFPHLPPEQRPFNLEHAALLFFAFGASGLVMMMKVLKESHTKSI
jgi:hypothetical protein